MGIWWEDLPWDMVSEFHEEVKVVSMRYRSPSFCCCTISLQQHLQTLWRQKHFSRCLTSGLEGLDSLRLLIFHSLLMHYPRESRSCLTLTYCFQRIYSNGKIDLQQGN